MEDLVTLIQAGHRNLEEGITQYLLTREGPAEAQDLAGGELVINGARLRTTTESAEDKKDEAPRFNFNYAEQAVFDGIIAHYRRAGMLITEPEAKKPAKPDRAPSETEIQTANLERAADEARKEYARRSAARGAHVIKFGQYGAEAVAEARKQYEDQKQELLRHERNTALAAGVDADTFDRYAPAAAASEAWKLAKDISYARKLASGKWIAKTIDIHTTGKRYEAVPVLDEARPLDRIKRVFFGKLWGKRDEGKILSAQNGALVLRRAAVIAAAPAVLAGSILLPPVEIGLSIAGGGWAAGKFAKNIADYKPGYKPGRTARWVLDRESAHEEILFSDFQSVHRGNKPERKTYTDAEITKEIAYAMIHADPADNTINSLDNRIANEIDKEVDRRLAVNTGKLAFRLGATALAASTMAALSFA